MKARTITTVLVAVGLAVSIVGTGAYLVIRRQAQLADAPRFGLSPAVVRVAEASPGTLEASIDYLATVEPKRTAQLSSHIMETVVAVSVREGDKVEKGDVIVRLDESAIRQEAEALDAQIAQAKAQLAAQESTIEALGESLALLRREAERDRKLHADGALPGARMEVSENRAREALGGVQAARHQVQAAREAVKVLAWKRAALQTKLEHATIRSPFDGVLAFRHVDAGDLAVPGKPLVTVEDRSSLVLAFGVPQDELAHVHAGQTVRFDDGKTRRTARITRLDRSLGRTQMARAEVEVISAHAAALPIGGYVRVAAVLPERAGDSIVPAESIVMPRQGTPYVFVVADDIARARPVTVVGSSATSAAVNGVSPGERVVVNTYLGWALLSSGRNVEVLHEDH